MNKPVLIIIALGLAISIVLIFYGGSRAGGNAQFRGAVENSEIKNGIQYINIEAKGGYSPRISNAKAGIPTKLVVKTNGTYDCSASLIIRSLGFQKILAQTGEEVIDLGVPYGGQSIQGLCGMGMYSFIINFVVS